MNDHELESFEAELRALRPAPPPTELLARLEAAGPVQESPPAQTVPRARFHLPDLWRWLAPATALAGLILGVGIWHSRHDKASVSDEATKALNPAPSSDVVEIDRQLVASYDAIAELSSGLPVRFHCQEWQDKVIFRDPLRGIAIERRTPRLEVVPVSLETY